VTFGKWKCAMVAMVNIATTKLMWIGSGLEHAEMGKFPCVVSDSGKSHLVPKAQKLMPNRCSGMQITSLQKKTLALLPIVEQAAEWRENCIGGARLV